MYLGFLAFQVKCMGLSWLTLVNAWTRYTLVMYFPYCCVFLACWLYCRYIFFILAFLGRLPLLSQKLLLLGRLWPLWTHAGLTCSFVAYSNSYFVLVLMLSCIMLLCLLHVKRNVYLKFKLKHMKLLCLLVLMLLYFLIREVILYNLVNLK